MSDKRTVATDALETLGTIIDDKQKRDAIHLAVEPVTALQDLLPGQRIWVREGGARAADDDLEHYTGIVDPFLDGPVAPGQRFWFVMRPRMVHSLRHVWTHPAFPDEHPEKAQPATYWRRLQSENWLRRFCDAADCPAYDTVIELIDKGQLPIGMDGEGGGSVDDDYLYFRGRDAHGEIPPEFWAHAEIVLGRPLEKRPSHFSCSC